MSAFEESPASTHAEDNPPPGFEPMVRASGFVRQCTGMYRDSERGILGARIRPQHLNPLNIAHGGFLATLIDTAFGWAVIQATGSARPMATVSLTIDYLSPARPGDWIEAHVEVHKAGRTLSHASLSLMDGERLIARGKAIFITSGASGL
ncbi:Thioesterase superfamily protein [compost metagenome]